MVSDAFNDRCRNFARRRSVRGRWACATPVAAATNASEGILRRNMTYIVPPVWTACLRERFAGSTFVDVIEAGVLGDVTCCSDRVKPSSAVPSLLFRAFASSGLPRRLFDNSRHRRQAALSAEGLTPGMAPTGDPGGQRSCRSLRGARKAQQTPALARYAHDVHPLWDDHAPQ